METHLRACVQESLQLLLYDNARFLCERLVAQYASEVNTHLLALCYYHSNQAYRCYHLLKGLSSKSCRYLFAQSCLLLGRLNEGREALIKHGSLEVPNGAAGLYLLGRIYRLSGRFVEAKESFAKALNLDPLLWSAYEELCMLGGDEEAAEVCRVACSGKVDGKPLAAAAGGAVAAATTRPQHGSQAGGRFANNLNFIDSSGVSASGYSTACTPWLDAAPPLNKNAPSTSAFLIRREGKTAAVPPPGPHFSSALPTNDNNPNAGGGSREGAQTQLFGGPSWHTPSTPSAFTTPSAANSMSPSEPQTAAEELMSTESSASEDRAGHVFVTPDLHGNGNIVPPAPPQKAGAGAAPASFPGFKLPDGGSLPGCSAADDDDSATATPAGAGVETTPTFGCGKRVPGGGHGAAMKPARIQNEQQANKGRKITGKLFEDTASVRRSSRLAALTSCSTFDHASASAEEPQTQQTQPPQQVQQHQAQQQAQAQASQSIQQPPHRGKGGALIFDESQNLPDPSCPPPSAANFQNHFDLKIGDGGGSRCPQQPHQGGFVCGASEECSDTQKVLAQVLGLLSPLYEGVRHLSLLRCREAIAALKKLEKVSPSQYRTAAVQCLLGRAHFECMDYDVAASMFEAARSLDRYRVEGMDLYSTVLWHTKRDYELSYLAQEMVGLDRQSPQTWCVLGNFFSLQKEHESAVEFFQRALQLEPTHVYAYTLCGHEYLANEDFEKAATCYRNATRLDPRHYNAVYGMGQIYFRQEKYDMALVQFKSAANINTRSSVLHTCVGMTLHKQGMHDRALLKLKEAIALDRRNPLARYELSNVLTTLDRCSEALSELQHLNSIAPGEASVFIQMGKLYKRLGDLKKAQQHLELALSFSSSSSDAGLIKATIEKLGVDEEKEDEEM